MRALEFEPKLQPESFACNNADSPPVLVQDLLKEHLAKKPALGTEWEETKPNLTDLIAQLTEQIEAAKNFFAMGEEMLGPGTMKAASLSEAGPRAGARLDHGGTLVHEEGLHGLPGLLRHVQAVLHQCCHSGVWS